MSEDSSTLLKHKISLVNFTKKNIDTINDYITKAETNLVKIEKADIFLGQKRKELGEAKQNLINIKNILNQKRNELTTKKYNFRHAVNSLPFLKKNTLKSFKDKIKDSTDTENFMPWFKEQDYFKENYVVTYKDKIDNLIKINNEVKEANNKVKEANNKVKEANKGVEEANNKVEEAIAEVVGKNIKINGLEGFKAYINRLKNDLEKAKEQLVKDLEALKTARENQMCTYHQYIF